MPLRLADFPLPPSLGPGPLPWRKTASFDCSYGYSIAVGLQTFLAWKKQNNFEQLPA
jgi:hypothetical protein